MTKRIVTVAEQPHSPFSQAQLEKIFGGADALKAAQAKAAALTPAGQRPKKA